MLGQDMSSCILSDYLSSCSIVWFCIAHSQSVTHFTCIGWWDTRCWQSENTTVRLGRWILVLVGCTCWSRLLGLLSLRIRPYAYLRKCWKVSVLFSFSRPCSNRKRLIGWGHSALGFYHRVTSCLLWGWTGWHQSLSPWWLGVLSLVRILASLREECSFKLQSRRGVIASRQSPLHTCRLFQFWWQQPGIYHLESS